MPAFVVHPLTGRALGGQSLSANGVVGLNVLGTISTASAAKTIYAPAAAGDGECFAVQYSGANALTIDGNGSTLDGGASAQFTGSGTVMYVRSGSGWIGAVPSFAFDREGEDVRPIYPIGSGFTSRVSGPVTAMSAFNIDWSTANLFTKTLGAGANVITFSNEVDGQIITVVLTSDPGGSDVTWPAAVQWTGGTEPAQTHTGVDIYTFVRTGGVVRGSYVQNFS